MLRFEKPEYKITEYIENNHYGKFELEPLERGFGTTIGNALRRVMLSSLPGSAITSVKIVFYLEFLLKQRGRNCSIFPSEILLFGEKTRRSLLKFGNSLSNYLFCKSNRLHINQTTITFRIVFAINQRFIIIWKLNSSSFLIKIFFTTMKTMNFCIHCKICF